MAEPLRIAAIGLGRIGCIHARHVQELGAEQGVCKLTALVDCDLERATLLAKKFADDGSSEIRAFYDVDRSRLLRRGCHKHSHGRSSWNGRGVAGALGTGQD